MTGLDVNAGRLIGAEIFRLNDPFATGAVVAGM